jgi:hypothetical protein
VKKIKEKPKIKNLNCYWASPVNGWPADAPTHACVDTGSPWSVAQRQGKGWPTVKLAAGESVGEAEATLVLPM